QRQQDKGKPRPLPSPGVQFRTREHVRDEDIVRAETYSSLRLALFFREPGRPLFRNEVGEVRFEFCNEALYTAWSYSGPQQPPRQTDKTLRSHIRRPPATLARRRRFGAIRRSIHRAGDSHGA